MKGPTTLIALVVAILAAPRADAQTPVGRQAPPVAKKPLPPDTRKWDFEFHRGFGFGESKSDGSGDLPGAGDSFTTGGGSSSRRVTSWYFGDGSKLLNEVLASFGRSERIIALDTILTDGATEFTVGHSFGGRATRRMSRRLILEIAFDYAAATITPTDGVNTALNLTSTAFVRAFDGLVITGQGTAFTDPAITSDFTVGAGSGSELITTGSLVFRSPPRFVSPYVVLGGGIAKTTGEAVATLSGRYSFQLPNGARIDERDNVRVRFSGGVGMVAVAGGGVNLNFSRSYGIRLDGRLLWVQNHIDTRVDTEPTVLESQPADAIWSSLNPGIQFANNRSTNIASNLTAPALSGTRTMNGSGFHRRTSLSIGFFRRF